MLLLKILLLLLLFITVHELGHVIFARIFQLKITKIGFAIKPIPHFRVAVKWPVQKTKRILYVMSGFLFFILFSILLYTTNLIDIKLLKTACFIQFIIETNPVYSDFMILLLSDKVYSKIKKTRGNFKGAFKSVYDKFVYGKQWYLYFLTWLILIFIIVKTILL